MLVELRLSPPRIRATPHSEVCTPHQQLVMFNQSVKLTIDSITLDIDAGPDDNYTSWADQVEPLISVIGAGMAFVLVGASLV